MINIYEKPSLKTFRVKPFNGKGFVKIEKFYRGLLTPKTRKDINQTTPRLQYMPGYIRKFIINKIYWKKQCEKCPRDPIAKSQHQLSAKIVKAEILLHSDILENFDAMMNSSPTPLEDKTHFSQSLDTDLVKSLVKYFKKNEHIPYFMLSMLFSLPNKEGTDQMDFSLFLYFWYAVYAAYADFILFPPSQRGTYIPEYR